MLPQRQLTKRLARGQASARSGPYLIHLILIALIGLALGLRLVVAGQPLDTSLRLFLPLLQKEGEEADPPDEPVLFGQVHSGEGTYYWEADGSGNCLFDPSPENLLVAAMNQADYNQAALCGAYAQVSGPKGTITVRIVDRCPECAPGDIDLSPQAFALIAEMAHGRVPISWQLVSPPLEGPISYRFKDGSNQWWTAVQVRHHRNPIVSLEYLDNQGVFQPVPRTMYNYFVQTEPGMGPGPYTFRVTDIFGRTLVDTAIPHVENGVVPGQAQFPRP
jgi:expansin